MRILFVDTNILLHYNMFDDIDWPSLVEHDEVLLVISMAVTRNLDRQKSEHPQKRVRDRAQAVLRRFDALESADPDGAARPHVRLQFLSTDPLIDFGAAGLSRDVDDDWLIASMLAFRDSSAGYGPILVTADRGLRLKARHFGFEVLALPDEIRLPDEADATERELRNLKVEREKFAAALPRLRVTWPGGAAHLHKQFRVQPVDAFDVEGMMRQVSAAWPVAEAVPPKPKRREVILGRKVAPQSDDAALMQALHGLYTTFPGMLLKARNDFLNSYREYLQKRQVFLLNAARTVSVALVLHNDGGAPADDVDVFVGFPLDALIHPEAAKELPPPTVPVMPPGLFSASRPAPLVGPWGRPAVCGGVDRAQRRRRPRSCPRIAAWRKAPAIPRRPSQAWLRGRTSCVLRDVARIL